MPYHPSQSRKGERDGLREKLLGYGCSREQIATEMIRRYGVRPRLAWRYAFGWPQWKLAMRYNECTDGAGMTDARISEYETWPQGGSRPSPRVLAGLAAAFGHGCTPAKLVDADDLERMTPADRLLLASGPRPEPDPCQPAAGRPSSDVQRPESRPVEPQDETRDRQHRRNALVHAGIEPGREEEFVMSAADQSAEFAAWAEATNTGEITLEQLHHEIRAIAHSHDSGPMPLFHRAVLLRNRTFSLLEGRQRPGQTRDLYLCAGWLCTLLSWFTVDLGYHDAALTQARTAWLCGELAGHNGLRAWSRAAQGSVTYWQGGVRAAAELAEDGLRFTGPGTAGVMLASMAATNWAQLGRQERATQALERGQTEREKHDGPDEIGGILACGPARQLGFTGSAQLSLGNHEAAADAFTTALAYFGTADAQNLYGTEMMVRADAARATLQLGRVERAVDVLSPMFALPTSRRHAPLLQRLVKVTDDLVAPALRNSQRARDLRDRIEDFRSVALPGTALPS